MLNEIISQTKLKKWSFGRYINEYRQLAFLLIRYISKGKMAARPLVLPHSDHAYPKQVMKKLLDAGADIDPKLDFDRLVERLTSLDISDGVYLQKAGVQDGYFVLGGKVYGSQNHSAVLDVALAELSAKRVGKSGTLRSWQREVAIPAEHSSFIMFGIALALCAPVYEEILSDEGVAFNLAGTSGLGKTTVVQAAQSVIGPVSNLHNWNGTPRGICEALAACSDTLYILDDWEKIDASGSISKVLRTQTHSITAGTSKIYSNSVRGGLPDYTWSCPILTSGPWSVEEQARLDNFRRTNGDRRRMIDISIEKNDGDGIWDNLPKAADAGEYARNFRLAVKANYGEAFHHWLKTIYEDRDGCIEDVREHVEAYATNNRMAADTGFEQTITRKFGIVYAAGMIAIEDHLLPWDIDGFLDAIVKLHNLARNSIRNEAQIVKTAVLTLDKATEDDTQFPSVASTTQAKFSGKKPITGLICQKRSCRHLHISLDTLHRVVGGKSNADLLIDRMQQIGAHIPGPKGRTCVQVKVTVGSKTPRRRMLKLDLDIFDQEVEHLTT